VRFTIQKEIFDIDLEDKKILLDSNSGRYIELNSTAAKIFEFVKDDQRTLEQITHFICENYDVSIEEASKEIHGLLKKAPNIFLCS
tara:strand:- start:3803 stop:4060 length:258 start_codon:yes stop_codon:yes gene_type:complete